MGSMQDRVPIYPTTGNKSKWDPLCMFVFCSVFLFTLLKQSPSCTFAAEPGEWNLQRAATLQQFHFAHWLLSWVLCDCNWLESLKLASPCQPWKLWNHKAWYSYQACCSLMAQGAKSLQSSEHSECHRLYPISIHHTLEGLVLDVGFVWGLFFSISEACCRMNRFRTD